MTIQYYNQAPTQVPYKYVVNYTFCISLPSHLHRPWQISQERFVWIFASPGFFIFALRFLHIQALKKMKTEMLQIKTHYF